MDIVMNLLSVLYLAVFALSGCFAAKLLFPGDRPFKQIFWGLTIGLLMLLWLPALFAFVLNFTLTAQLLALAIAAGTGIVCAVLLKKRGEIAVKRKPLRDERAFLLTTLPLILIGTVLICNHTITNASNGSLHVGQSTYGDLAMHLGFISSISVQETFPPMYSIMPDTPVGYPFLCDSVSSTFYTLGATLRFAAILPAVYAYIVVVFGVYFLFEQIFKRNSVASFATFLFFIGGGFGFAYFFDNAQTFAGLTSNEAWESWLEDFYHITADVAGSQPLDRIQDSLLNGFYETPTNFVETGMRWVNPIADMLVPQRATLFGWALLFPALQMLYRAAIEDERRLFIPLGVLAGFMPLVHTHSFLALGIISVFLIAAMGILALAKSGDESKAYGRRLVFFLLYGVIAVAIAAPQLFGFTFKQSGSGDFVKLHFNWCNVSDGWLWFYIKNLGLTFILMPMAFLASKKQHKLFYGGALLIWLISELFVFQPNTYDNNKLLFVWYALTCGIVANYLASLYDRIVDGSVLPDRSKERTNRLVPLSRRISQRLLCAVVIIVMMLSGVMTLVREYVSADHIGTVVNADGSTTFGYSESGYELVSAKQVEMTEWINANTEPDATFLTATNHNNAIAMLTGRNIVCGASTFLHFHGVGYQQRHSDIRLMYEQPSANFSRLAEQYGVDYVFIGSYETGSYNVDQGWFDGLEKVFDNGACRLYRVAP